MNRKIAKSNHAESEVDTIKVESDYGAVKTFKQPDDCTPLFVGRPVRLLKKHTNTNILNVQNLIGLVSSISNENILVTLFKINITNGELTTLVQLISLSKDCVEVLRQNEYNPLVGDLVMSHVSPAYLAKRDKHELSIEKVRDWSTYQTLAAQILVVEKSIRHDDSILRSIVREWKSDAKFELSTHGLLPIYYEQDSSKWAVFNETMAKAIIDGSMIDITIQCQDMIRRLRSPGSLTECDIAIAAKAIDNRDQRYLMYHARAFIDNCNATIIESKPLLHALFDADLGDVALSIMIENRNKIQHYMSLLTDNLGNHLVHCFVDNNAKYLPAALIEFNSLPLGEPNAKSQTILHLLSMDVTQYPTLQRIAQMPESSQIKQIDRYGSKQSVWLLEDKHGRQCAHYIAIAAAKSDITDDQIIETLQCLIDKVKSLSILITVDNDGFTAIRLLIEKNLSVVIQFLNLYGAPILESLQNDGKGLDFIQIACQTADIELLAKVLKISKIDNLTYLNQHPIAVLSRALVRGSGAPENCLLCLNMLLGIDNHVDLMMHRDCIMGSDQSMIEYLIRNCDENTNFEQYVQIVMDYSKILHTDKKIYLAIQKCTSKRIVDHYMHLQITNIDCAIKQKELFEKQECYFCGDEATVCLTPCLHYIICNKCVHQHALNQCFDCKMPIDAFYLKDGKIINAKQQQALVLKFYMEKCTKSESVQKSTHLQCSICLDALIDAVLTPCGHSACRECSDGLIERNKQKCHICRKKIEKVQPLYLA